MTHGRNRTPAHYIYAYVYCIKIHVWYSMQELEKALHNTFKKSHAVKEAYCLHQSVVNSSVLFCMLTIQSPTAIVRWFMMYLQDVKHISTFHKPLNKWYVSHKNHKIYVFSHSICHNHCCPPALCTPTLS